MLRRVLACVMLGACAAGAPAPPREACAPAPASAMPTAASSRSMADAIPYDLPRSDDFPPSPPPPPALPGASGSQPVLAILTVTITKTGSLFVDGRSVSPDALARLAREAIAWDPSTRAVIQADAAATWGLVVGVMDRLKQGGIARLAFAVSALPPPSPAPSAPPAPPRPARGGVMPEDCTDICSIGVRCGLGHVKDSGDCESWCLSTNDMGAYGCMALQAQDCDAMSACWKKERAQRGTRRKGEEGKMGPPAR